MSPASLVRMLRGFRGPPAIDPEEAAFERFLHRQRQHTRAWENRRDRLLALRRIDGPFDPVTGERRDPRRYYPSFTPRKSPP